MNDSYSRDESKRLDAGVRANTQPPGERRQGGRGRPTRLGLSFRLNSTRASEWPGDTPVFSHFVSLEGESSAVRTPFPLPSWLMTGSRPTRPLPGLLLRTENKVSGHKQAVGSWPCSVSQVTLRRALLTRGERIGSGHPLPPAGGKSGDPTAPLARLRHRERMLGPAAPVRLRVRQAAHKLSQPGAQHRDEAGGGSERRYLEPE